MSLALEASQNMHLIAITHTDIQCNDILSSHTPTCIKVGVRGQGQPLYGASGTDGVKRTQQ